MGIDLFNINEHKTRDKARDKTRDKFIQIDIESYYSSINQFVLSNIIVFARRNSNFNMEEISVF